MGFIAADCAKSSANGNNGRSFNWCEGEVEEGRNQHEVKLCGRAAVCKQVRALYVLPPTLTSHSGSDGLVEVTHDWSYWNLLCCTYCGSAILWSEQGGIVGRDYCEQNAVLHIVELLWTESWWILYCFCLAWHISYWRLTHTTLFRLQIQVNVELSCICHDN